MSRLCHCFQSKSNRNTLSKSDYWCLFLAWAPLGDMYAYQMSGIYQAYWTMFKTSGYPVGKNRSNLYI